MVQSELELYCAWCGHRLNGNDARRKNKVCIKCYINRAYNNLTDKTCAQCKLELKPHDIRRAFKRDENYICQSCQHRNRKLILVNQFGGSCQSCGYSRYIDVLQFHHIDKTEKHLYSSTGSTNLKEVEEHPERFVLYCANCHQEEHAQERARNKIAGK